jgi:hypothetical protein
MVVVQFFESVRVRPSSAPLLVPTSFLSTLTHNTARCTIGKTALQLFALHAKRDNSFASSASQRPVHRALSDGRALRAVQQLTPRRAPSGRRRRLSPPSSPASSAAPSP